MTNSIRLIFNRYRKCSNDQIYVEYIDLSSDFPVPNWNIPFGEFWTPQNFLPDCSIYWLVCIGCICKKNKKTILLTINKLGLYSLLCVVFKLNFIFNLQSLQTLLRALKNYGNFIQHVCSPCSFHIVTYFWVKSYIKKRRLWLDFVYWKLVGSWKIIFMVKGLLMVIRLRVT